MLSGGIMSASLDAGGRIRRAPSGNIVPVSSTWHENLGRELSKDEDVLMRGVLEKKVLVPEIEWFDRQVVVAKDSVEIGHVGENKMIDSIPLTEIVDVQLVKHDSSPVAPRRASVASQKGQSRGRRRSVAESNVAALPKRRVSAASRGRLSSNASGLSCGDEEKFEFVIKTELDGYNSGRPYFFRCGMDEVRTGWIACLKTAIKDAKARQSEDNLLRPVEKFRKKMRKRFEAHSTQTVIALIIAFNFAANVYAAEVLPEEGSQMQQVFDIIEYVCTSIFILEILVNLFVHWWYDFLMDGWNYFDFVAVSLSLTAFFIADLPGFSLLRLVRVFRVLRLLKRLSWMRLIINSLVSSVIPVFNAFVVVLLITAIYAVLAVSLFRERNPVLFGDFSRALFTMFQMSTGDNWGVMTREFFPDGGGIDRLVAFFFISYVLLVGIVLLNIVVAVLLDEFIQSVAAEKLQQAAEKRLRYDPNEGKATSALDPLLASLASLNDADDVDHRTEDLFDMLAADFRATSAAVMGGDLDEDFSLSYERLAEGLRKLDLEPVIHLSKEDFDDITHNFSSDVNRDGGLKRNTFVQVVRKQLRLFVQRKLSNELRDEAFLETPMGTVIYDLKVLNNFMEEIAKQHRSFADEHSNLHKAVEEIRSILNRNLSRGGSYSPPASLMSPAVVGRRASVTLSDANFGSMQSLNSPNDAARPDVGGSALTAKARLPGQKIASNFANDPTQDWRAGSDETVASMPEIRGDRLDSMSKDLRRSATASVGGAGRESPTAGILRGGRTPSRWRKQGSRPRSYSHESPTSREGLFVRLVSQAQYDRECDSAERKAEDATGSAARGDGKEEVGRERGDGGEEWKALLRKLEQGSELLLPEASLKVEGAGAAGAVVRTRSGGGQGEDGCTEAKEGLVPMSIADFVQRNGEYTLVVKDDAASGGGQAAATHAASGAVAGGAGERLAGENGGSQQRGDGATAQKEGGVGGDTTDERAAGAAGAGGESDVAAGAGAGSSGETPTTGWNAARETSQEETSQEKEKGAVQHNGAPVQPASPLLSPAPAVVPSPGSAPAPRPGLRGRVSAFSPAKATLAPRTGPAQSPAENDPEKAGATSRDDALANGRSPDRGNGVGVGARAKADSEQEEVARGWSPGAAKLKDVQPEDVNHQDRRGGNEERSPRARKSREGDAGGRAARRAGRGDRRRGPEADGASMSEAVVIPSPDPPLLAPVSDGGARLKAGATAAEAAREGADGRRGGHVTSYSRRDAGRERGPGVERPMEVSQQLVVGHVTPRAAHGGAVRGGSRSRGAAGVAVATARDAATDGHEVHVRVDRHRAERGDGQDGLGLAWSDLDPIDG